ncbi:MAG: TlpA family protein disulfide reductase [Anaerolineales bacterium]
MTPIVDGLVVEHEEQVDFKFLNAGQGDGKQLFEFYGLPGHPSYILLSPDGEVLWRGFGPVSAEALGSEIEKLTIPRSDADSSPG